MKLAPRLLSICRASLPAVSICETSSRSTTSRLPRSFARATRRSSFDHKPVRVPCNVNTVELLTVRNFNRNMPQTLQPDRQTGAQTFTLNQKQFAIARQGAPCAHRAAKAARDAEAAAHLLSTARLSLSLRFEQKKPAGLTVKGKGSIARCTQSVNGSGRGISELVAVYLAGVRKLLPRALGE